jgi:glyoxylase-like metal-dependent hydrolase (beta-lactamase superfamily II)
MMNIAVMTFLGANAGPADSPRVIAIHPIRNLMQGNVYLLETEKELFLIDAGYPGYERMVLKELKKFPDKKLTLIFITHAHFDHFGSARALQKKTGAMIGIHRLDAPALMRGATIIDSAKGWGRIGLPFKPLAEKLLSVKPCLADILLENNDRLDHLGLPATVVHTPGHSDGHCCLIVSDSIAFTGDLLLTLFGPEKQNLYARSWKTIDSSLAVLKALNPATCYTGHHRMVITREELVKIK